MSKIRGLFMRNIFFILLVTTLFSGSVFATKLQILFTNDLHGNTEFYKAFPNIGGYARIKYIINQQRQKAAKDGIETIVLDGGDFLEGNISYLANHGGSLMQLHNSIGYDAVVLGNHDYLMSTDQLNDLLNNVPPQFNLLAANLKMQYQTRALKEYIKPYTILNRGGLKIAIVGVTTNEKFYTFRLPHVRFKRPYRVAYKWAKRLAPEVDFTIALTHLGFSRDKKLITKSKNIDLVVGAHSHTLLYEPHWQNNKTGRKIPIVQSGSGGHYVGKIILDIDHDHTYKILSYQLLSTRDGQEDMQIKQKVQFIEQQLEDEFGKEWLNEPIGYSDLSFKKYRESKERWGKFIAETVRVAADADVGFHASEFAGGMFPTGEITRKEVFNSYPRVFDLNQRKGWKIYTFQIPGFLLSPVIKLIYKYNNSLYLSGVSFKYKQRGEKLKIKNIKINGKKLKRFKLYTLAVPEGIILGALGISKTFTKLVTKDINQTPVYIWEALNDAIEANGGIVFPTERRNSFMALKKK